jgi:hypothetical protein
MPDATKPTPRSDAACTCPRIDHSEGTYIVSADCPKHGNPTMTPEREPPEGLTDEERRLWEAAMKASPGPWAVVELDWGSPWFYYDGARQVVVSGWAVEGPRRVGNHELSALTGADANHIAAANPEAVLAMLSEAARIRAALTELADPKNWHEHTEGWMGELPWPQERARAALARPAEGEEQEKP